MSAAPTPPRPPANLASRRPSEVILRPGDLIHRFHTAIYEPLFFDRGRAGRLNDPADVYGVLYGSKEPHGAFAETFLRVPGRTQLPDDLLAQKAYVQWRVTRELKLVGMVGRGLARIGATAEVVHGPMPYDLPQEWSAALHAHPSAFDGIAYTARHDDEALCYAIFDHAENALEEVLREHDLNQNWFWEVANDYDVGSPPA